MKVVLDFMKESVIWVHKNMFPECFLGRGKDLNMSLYYIKTFFFASTVYGVEVKQRFGGCSTESDLRGCFSRSELNSVHPDLASSLEEIEDYFGIYYENRNFCYCYGDFCNVGVSSRPMSYGQITLFVCWSLVLYR